MTSNDDRRSMIDSIIKHRPMTDSKISSHVDYRSIIKSSSRCSKAVRSPQTNARIVKHAAIKRVDDSCVDGDASDCRHRLSPRKAKIKDDAMTDRSSIKAIMKKLSDAAYGKDSDVDSKLKNSTNLSSRSNSINADMNMMNSISSPNQAASSSSRYLTKSIYTYQRIDQQIETRARHPQPYRARYLRPTHHQ